MSEDVSPEPVWLLVESGRNSAAMELTFSDWNTPIDIAVPGDDEVDATPWVDEEELQSLDIVPVLPSSVPEGWEPTLVQVMAGEEYYGDEEYPDDCQLLEVDHDQTTLDDAELEAVLASLAPIDVAAVIDVAVEAGSMEGWIG